jgi:glutamine synthetase
VYDTEGQPFAGDPRYILKRGLAQARDMGYGYNTGPEVEFFLFKMDGEPRVSPVPQDVGSYFDFSPRDLASQVRNHIAQALQQMGIEVEATHHEVAPGQHEVDFHYADALVSADAVVTLRYAIKAVAQSHGLYATFMPKPLFGRISYGCSGGANCQLVQATCARLRGPGVHLLGADQPVSIAAHSRLSAGPG